MACIGVDNVKRYSFGLQEPSIDADKLSYEIFSILETNFLFGSDDQEIWVPKQPQLGSEVLLKGEDVVQEMEDHRWKICILSIDGGGVQNILSGKMLSFLETALKNKSGNPNARIADYFDVAAGAGVGGIFMAMLFASKDQNSPIFHADDTWKFLEAEGEKLCHPARKSNHKGNILKRFLRKTGGADCATTSGLEKAIKEAFKDEKTGRSLTLKNTLKPVLIPCYDLASMAPFLFSRADALESDSFDFNLWEVCMATAAEPGLFGPVCMKSANGSTRCVGVDGGLAMNNPTAAAITHVLHNKQDYPFVRGVEDILVLSLGAGGQVLGGSFDYEDVKKWKSKDWARPSARISADGSSELVDQAVALAFGQSRSSNYVRIQANGTNLGRHGTNIESCPVPNKVKMLVGVADDMLKQKNVESVLFNGKRIGERSNLEKLEWFAEQLVLEHQRRSCGIAPAVAFKQATPKNC
ncbi:patatin-like protein 6 [Dorcoceras hygrometricum]|uniref:Patatin n=1 Tax=Dorcoceras hygrometricum TaxID=472368 RepID=A0A2Z7BYT9_9LAMI|nr:patatin-like protein 6 [Dorcoceras hygrometricum]